MNVFCYLKNWFIHKNSYITEFKVATVLSKADLNEKCFHINEKICDALSNYALLQLRTVPEIKFF